ncbi:MAG: hypothetical protein ABII06_17965 [Pseudomonadota bacterium]
MFDKLGVVTNCWAKVLERGARFEGLMARFAEKGFRHQEIRDGGYLRHSEFGRFIEDIEGAISHYSDGVWKEICEKDRLGKGLGRLLKGEDRHLLDRMIDFSRVAKGLILSYAFACPWLTRPENMEADNERIRQAIKLSYLFSPERARLRFVALDPVDEVRPEIAISNLKRYRSLLPDYPMIYALENSHQSATLTLQLALKGGVSLTYDEANIYRPEGIILNEPEEFWSAVKCADLVSIHLKQKGPEGVFPRLGEGLVDFQAMFRRLRAMGYTGDFLFENRPTDDPLEDALQSRAFILSCE